MMNSHAPRGPGTFVSAPRIADQSAEPTFNRDFNNKTGDAARWSGYTAAGIREAANCRLERRQGGFNGSEMNELGQSWNILVWLGPCTRTGRDSNAGGRDRWSKWGARQGRLMHKAMTTSVTPTAAKRNVAEA